MDVLSGVRDNWSVCVILHFQERMPYGLFVPDVP